MGLIPQSGYFFFPSCLSVWSIQSLGVNPNIQQWIYFFFPSCFPSFLLYFLIMISQITWNSNTSLSTKYLNLISLALTQFQDTTLLAQVVQHNGALERKHCCICNFFSYQETQGSVLLQVCAFILLTIRCEMLNIASKIHKISLIPESLDYSNSCKCLHQDFSLVCLVGLKIL